MCSISVLNSVCSSNWSVKDSQICSPINENQHSFISISHETSPQKKSTCPNNCFCLTEYSQPFTAIILTLSIPKLCPLNDCFMFAVLGVIPKALCMLEKESTSALSLLLSTKNVYFMDTVVFILTTRIFIERMLGGWVSSEENRNK